MARRYNYQIDPAPFDPLGAHVSDTALGSAKTLTPASGADRVLIQALTSNVRYTLDGTTPTAGVGFRLTADTDPVIIQLGTGMALKVIQEATGAAIQYQWGK